MDISDEAVSLWGHIFIFTLGIIDELYGSSRCQWSLSTYNQTEHVEAARYAPHIRSSSFFSVYNGGISTTRLLTSNTVLA